MQDKIKNFLKNIFSYYLWHILISNYQSLKFLLLNNYSSRGNIDKKLMNMIKKKNGFYLEVGAYNGISESVSLRFEKELNWSGLLIEPNPLHFKYLKKNRRKNLCLNYICLNKKFFKKKLFIKNLNQMSYLVDDNSKLYFKDYPISKINQLAKESKSGNFVSYKCNIQSLENIFSKQKIKIVDLAIIDVEGSELELLAGINFNKVRINYMCIESYNFKKLNKFMKHKNYVFVSKLHKEDYVFKKKKIDKNFFDVNGFVLLDTSLSYNNLFFNLVTDIEKSLLSELKNPALKKFGGYLMGNFGINQGPYAKRLYKLVFEKEFIKYFENLTSKKLELFEINYGGNLVLPKKRNSTFSH